MRMRGLAKKALGLTAVLAAAALVASVAMVSWMPASSASAATPVPGPLTQVVAATIAQLPPGAAAIERGHVRAALTEVHAENDPTGAEWIDMPSAVTPASAGSFSVGFDDGHGSPSGLPDSFGTRGAIVTLGGSGYIGTVFTISGQSVVCDLGTRISSASQLLAAVSTLTCPSRAPHAGTPAITGLWAWGNSVDPAVDNRGLGQPGMAPASLAAFAKKHHIDTVYLSVPWASNEGAIADWLSASVDALHAKGVKVAALGGDSAWLAQPQLAAQWLSDARAAAHFDSVELDVEPWAGDPNPDFAVITPQLIGVVDAVRTAAGSLPVGIDLPWWLTERSAGSGSVFDAVAQHVDSVAIVAFADHASGDDGIIALASAAAASARAAGVKYSIGVETDTPAVAGGAQFTFYDEGADALATETATAAAAFAGQTGFTGISVEHLLSWKALLAR